MLCSLHHSPQPPLQAISLAPLLLRLAFHYSHNAFQEKVSSFFLWANSPVCVVDPVMAHLPSHVPLWVSVLWKSPDLITCLLSRLSFHLPAFYCGQFSPVVYQIAHCSLPSCCSVPDFSFTFNCLPVTCPWSVSCFSTGCQYPTGRLITCLPHPLWSCLPDLIFGTWPNALLFIGYFGTCEWSMHLGPVTCCHAATCKVWHIELVYVFLQLSIQSIPFIA